MVKKYFLLLAAVSAFASCFKSEVIEHPCQKLPVPVNYTIRDVFVINPDTIFACGGDNSEGVILRSTDNGNTWQLIPRIFDHSINAIYFTDSQTGYAADADILIYKTVDGGTTWNPFYANEWPLTVNRNLKSICFTDDSTGFVCGGKNFGNGVLFQTRNAGNYWSFSEYAHEYRGIHFNGEGIGVMCGYGSLLRTADFGNSWENRGTGIFYTGITSDRDNNFWTCCFDGDVYASADNGITWYRKRNHKDHKIELSRINTIDVSPSGKIICAGYNGIFSFSDAGGNSWTTRQSFNGENILKITWLNDHSLVGVGTNGAIYKISI